MMFETYKKKLQEVQASVPKIFGAVALSGAKYAEKRAKELTNEAKLVDTGNYKQNWFGDKIKGERGVYGLVLHNPVEYASHLEYGHKLRNGKRWKGRFVGRNSLEDTEFYCLERLDKAFERAFIKYQESFIKPEE